MNEEANNPEVSLQCPQGIDQEKRKELVQKLIDGQASVEEEHYFYKTIENCQKCRCRDWCEQHLEIKTILKEKFAEKPAPANLIDEIKDKIKGIKE